MYVAAKVHTVRKHCILYPFACSVVIIIKNIDLFFVFDARLVACLYFTIFAYRKHIIHIESEIVVVVLFGGADKIRLLFNRLIKRIGIYFLLLVAVVAVALCVVEHHIDLVAFFIKLVLEAKFCIVIIAASRHIAEVCAEKVGGFG